MTVPASIPLSRTEVRAPLRDNGPAPAITEAAQDRTPEFSAHLAQQASAGGQAEARAPVHSAPPLAAAEAQVDAPKSAEEPGKVLQAVRQSLAAPLAALRLLAGTDGKADPAKTATEAADDTSAPANGDVPVEAAPTALIQPLAPGIAPVVPNAAPAAAQNSRNGPARPGAAGTSASAARTDRTAAAAPPAAPQSTPPAAQPAAFALANLVLEKDSAVPAGDASPQAAGSNAPARPAATDAAARAQPSTLAALTGAPERPASRKLRGDGEAALAVTRTADLPDTAAALALAQPASAPAASAEAHTQTAAAPQPLSFDQLVDSIARARDGVDPGGPVAVALRHGEFGRISLRIESDASGLSVAMASPDPAFAPAVAAAHAAAVAEPVRVAATEHRADTAGQNAAQGNSPSGNPSGQQRQSAAPQRPAANPVRSPAPRAERRGGIFA